MVVEPLGPSDVEDTRGSEIRFRALLESLPAVTYIREADDEGALSYVSPQVESVLGRTVEEFIADSKNYLDLIHPDDVESVREADRVSSETDAPFEVEFRYRTGDGRYVWLHSRSTLVRDESGTPSFWLGFFLDITDQRRAQDSFQRLVENHPAVSYAEAIDEEPGIIYISPQVQAMLGYQPESFVDAQFWSSIVHPDDRERFDTQNALADRTLSSFDLEYRMIAGDGRVVWVRDLASLVRDKNDLGIWQGFLLDITAEHVAEERFRILVEQLPAATNIFTETEAGTGSYRLEYMSPQIEQILGYPLGDWLAIGATKMLDRVVDPRDRQRVREADAHAEASGAPFHVEYRAVTADGRVLWIADDGVRVDRGQGAPRQWLGVMTDITERKRAEEDLRKSFELLREADEERRQLLERIVRAQEEERRRVASDIHDDPIQKMTAIGLRIGSLRRFIDDPEGLGLLEDFSETVSEAIARLRNLLFELHPPALDEAGLGAALRDALAEFEEETGVSASLRDELVTEPECDTRAVIYRIVQEALANVRKHARASSVTVTLTRDSAGVMVRVRDDGTGFDPVAATERGHLGLVSMRERAEMTGGRLRINSSPGSGTTVEAWVPGDNSRRGASESLGA